MSDGELISTVLTALEKWRVGERASGETKPREDRDLPLSYNEHDAASLLGIRWSALRDLRLSGQVEAVKLGKRVIYPRESLELLLEQKRKEAHTQGANSRGEGAP